MFNFCPKCNKTLKKRIEDMELEIEAIYIEFPYTQHWFTSFLNRKYKKRILCLKKEIKFTKEVLNYLKNR